jgi:hypothetical protein
LLAEDWEAAILRMACWSPLAASVLVTDADSVASCPAVSADDDFTGGGGILLAADETPWIPLIEASTTMGRGDLASDAICSAK